VVISGTDADVRGLRAKPATGRRFITSVLIQEGGEGGQRGAHVGGVARVVQVADALSDGIEHGQRSTGCCSHAHHGHEHSARAAIPVHETQRDRAQSSPARRSGSNYGLVTGMKPDGVVAVTLGVATLVSGTGGGVVVVTVC
jgi:hypothetical protein